MSAPKLSILISTRDRAEGLSRTLESFSKLTVDCDWEMIVADNGSLDHTGQVISSMTKRLPLIGVSEPRAGKSIALNTAIALAKGEMILFTDDDVIPSASYLTAYRRALERFPSAGVFCGPIVPLFPESTPQWLRSHSCGPPAFARFEPPFGEGELPPPYLPFGPNFAVRSSAIAGMRMREDLGASSDTVMGEDTEFVSRLRDQEETIIFVPEAGVRHVVREEQIAHDWLFERAFRIGRSFSEQRRHIDLVDLETPSPAPPLFEAGMQLNYYYGQLYQFRITSDNARATVMERAISELPRATDQQLFSKSLMDWLSSNP